MYTMITEISVSLFMVQLVQIYTSRGYVFVLVQSNYIWIVIAVMTSKCLLNCQLFSIILI